MLNLPLILDITIGLIFIYLTLSLLASEIQEIITTLLQWRAKHLKQSIKYLLMGNSEIVGNDPEAETLLNKFYQNPLIKTINHQSKDKFQNFLKNKIKFFSKINEQETAPSYIPGKIFALTLLEELELPKLSHQFSCLKLEKLRKKLLNKLQNLEEIAPGLLPILDEDLGKISQDFQKKKYSLDLTLIRFKNRFQEFITDHKINKDQEEVKLFEAQISEIKEIFFGEKNLQAIHKEMKLDLLYLAQLLDPKTAPEILNDLKMELGEELTHYVTQQVERIPLSLKENLIALSHRAQAKVMTVEEDLERLSQEMEIWFDNSMERASGVYKRNAKGFAFLLGLVIALAVNADSIHLINRLSTDGALRNIIVENASLIEAQCKDQSLDCIQKQTKNTLNNISLPIGWTKENIRNQWSSSFDSNPQILLILWQTLLTIFGWLISAIAISMGSSFWFELLGKIINVRNTGSKPASSANNETITSQKIK